LNEKGKLLEITLRIVQESLKDKSDTKIASNQKLINESGNKREFDIVIESIINKFEIITVIECKDYIKPVPVEKIEAFQSKCERIPKINKKVFVSKNGYQSDAINAAKFYGIEIYKVEEISKNLVNDWLPVSMISPVKASMIINNISITFHSNIKTHNFTQESIIFKDSIVKLGTIKDYLQESIKKAGIFNERMVLRPEGTEINKEENISINLKPSEILSLFDIENNEYKIKELEIWITILFEELSSKTTVERIISENNEMSTVITHDSDGPDIIKIVLKDGNPDEFTPFMINKKTGKIFDTGCSFKYEKIK